VIPTVEWNNRIVCLLDQSQLPETVTILECRDYQAVAQAIKELRVRGAPAIGVTAAMGVALGAMDLPESDYSTFETQLIEICDHLARTRPTAVNLFWALERMKKLVRDHRRQPIREVKDLLFDESQRILEEDIAMNKAMGVHGASLIQPGDQILTHCNAGALATAGYGTALGVIRAAWDQGKNIRVFADETRPVLQGARLTAWELMQDNIPVTLITDNMAGSLMQQGRVHRCIVGADRIAGNGDVANKIGTYSVAVLAKAHGIPFYVAAPSSTIDVACSSGQDITIEERSSQEVTALHQGKPIAPEGVDVWNPAFDITPAEYITAIITEKGVFKPQKISSSL
jgi:methylthioribose-1-phosphate isomerase